MSIHDEIGDLSGGQIHYWPGQRSDEVEAALVITDKRSSIKLDRDVTVLIPEVAAAEIARNLYTDEAFEFRSDAFRLATIRARTIATLVERDTDKKELVGFYGTNHELVKLAQELAWLDNAFDAGATAADLKAWGVSDITIQQLLWWQRREGESLLSQHIRAHRNGWALRWLAAARRDAYGNLLRFLKKGAFPKNAVEALAADFDEVREVMNFFEIKWDSDGQGPQPLVELSAQDVADWAAAFAKRVSFVCPDAKGRWASLPKVSLDNGVLRSDGLLLAKYFKHTGVTPEQFANLPENYFGRVGDVNA